MDMQSLFDGIAEAFTRSLKVVVEVAKELLAEVLKELDKEAFKKAVKQPKQQKPKQQKPKKPQKLTRKNRPTLSVRNYNKAQMNVSYVRRKRLR